jgi:2-oxoisovalerate dehydrogenase E1 component beta subunit
VIFMEPKRVYRASKADVPEGEYTLPIGQAKVVREGSQVTIVAWSAMVHTALEAGELLARDGIDAEIIDLRTIVPWDVDTVIASVSKTGRCVVAAEAPRTCGFASEVSATVHERAMAQLEAPVERITGFDTPFPYTLEHEYLPNAERVALAAKRTLEW